MIDPIRFIQEVLVNPETGRPFELIPAERDFLSRAFQIGPDGRALYPELIYGAVKKSGKTTFAGMILIYVIRVLGGRFAEGYVISNSREQAANRVFLAAARIVEASPRLQREARVSQAKITFTSTGATITAIASDYATAAGANPVLSCFDELWAFTTELDHRLFDEMVVPPTKPQGWRLTTTYAGFENESELLEGLYKRGLQGEQMAPGLYGQPGLLMAWHHDFISPWQTEEWRGQMRQQLRPSAYLRLIENRWVSSESSFVEMVWWDACTDSELRPVLYAPRLPIWVGVDVSLVRDHTAIVAVTWDAERQKVRLAAHKEWRPSPDEPLDFESTVEKTLIELSRRFAVRAVYFDPYQMQSTAQRLQAVRVPMVEYPQTANGLTEISTGLYELIKGRNLIVYPDDDLRLAVQRTVAKETPRGWQITKAKTSHQIDAVVALAMGCFGAVGAFTGPTPLAHTPDLLVDGKPVPMPKWCYGMLATVVTSPDGRAAIMYFACWPVPPSPGAPRTELVDFDVDGLANLHGRIKARVTELCRQLHARWDRVLVAPWLVDGFWQRVGVRLDSIPAEWLRPAAAEELRNVGLQYLADGEVKVTEPAYDKAGPLGAAFAFDGPVGGDPLKLAWWSGVRLAVELRMPRW